VIIRCETVDGNIPIKLHYQSHSDSKEYSSVLSFHVLTDNKPAYIYGYRVKKKKTETENLRLYIFQIF